MTKKWTSDITDCDKSIELFPPAASACELRIFINYDDVIRPVVREQLKVLLKHLDKIPAEEWEKAESLGERLYQKEIQE